MDDAKIEDLLKEFQKHREEIQKMIKEVSEIREKLERLIPENLEYRYKMLFEERVKIIVAFFNTILDMRKEITKSVKDELELRRKVLKSDDEINLEDVLNISEFANKVEDLRRKRDSVIEKTENKHDPLIKKLSLDIPGITDEENKNGEIEGRKTVNG